MESEAWWGVVGMVLEDGKGGGLSVIAFFVGGCMEVCLYGRDFLLK